MTNHVHGVRDQDLQVTNHVHGVRDQDLSRAAELLQIKPTTLHEMIKRLGLKGSRPID